MSACQQTSVADGWMMGCTSTPKQRALCQCCLDWLVGEGLAVCMPLRSDAMLPLYPPCKLPFAGRNLPLGTSPDAMPPIAAYGGDATMGEPLAESMPLRSDEALPSHPAWVGCLCTAARPTSLRSPASQVLVPASCWLPPSFAYALVLLVCRDSLHSGGWVGSGVQCVNTLYFKLPEVMGLDPYRRVCARCILSSSAVTVAVGQVYVSAYFRPQP